MLTISPAPDAVVIILPPMPPLDRLMRSVAYVTPVVAPMVITAKFVSIPACNYVKLIIVCLE